MRIYAGTTSVPRPWGEETLMYEVDMDLRMLHAMARKALSNKQLKSTDGALTVKVIGTIGNVTPTKG